MDLFYDISAFFCITKLLTNSSYITKNNIICLNILNCIYVQFMLNLISIGPQEILRSKFIVINNQHIHVFAQFYDIIRKF